MSIPKEMNSLLYAMKTQPDIGRTRLMKYIFFVDAVSFYQRGKPIFEEEYIRMPKGHVPPAAYSVTGESNDYFQVIFPTSAQPHYGFRLLKEPNPQDFSRYERFIIDMILRAIGRYTATNTSALTHKFRSWENHSDGSNIPIDKCISGDQEWNLLEKFGAHLGEYQKFYKLQVLANVLSKECTRSVSSVPLEYFEAFKRELDILIQSFPTETLPEFYDAHLAWDDTIRLLISVNPKDVAPSVSEHCDAFYFVTGGISTKIVSLKEIENFCKEYYSRLEIIREGILKQKPPTRGGKDGNVDDIVGKVMKISRDLALHSPSGR